MKHRLQPASLLPISAGEAPIPHRSHCPIAYALDTFGDRWTLLIIRDLIFKGKRRYGEFAEAEEGIATNILADRLARLRNEGIVSVVADPSDSRGKLYSLTEKGLDLAPLLIEMILWSASHDSASAAEPGFISRARNARQTLLAEIRAANLRPVGEEVAQAD